MDARAIIAELRRGQSPSDSEISWFAQGLASGEVSDAQAGAFAMAVCLQGLSQEARRALTLAMRDSGDVLNWDLGGPVLDKHSTGGVGDCVSLLLAPALAECGAYVPMISGRGLGHTGGTLDKLEAIPGLTTQVSEEQLYEITRDVGCSIVGATGSIAPADKRLYAIRDVTATVESLDLITASILSKKLAASPEALVLDVKIGTGAFMKSQAEAEALARSLVETANAAGCKCTALITDMNQPVASSLGNALEIAEVMRALTSGKPSQLSELSALLGAEVLFSCGLAASLDEGAEKLRSRLMDGRAAERFGRMIAAQGGPADFAENWQECLPAAPIQRQVFAPVAGYLSAIAGEALGLAVVRLGGGRMVENDRIDPAVGIWGLPRLGTALERGAPLAVIHAGTEAAADEAEQALLNAIRISDEAPKLPPLIHERIA
ncbi:thymidine phosphorylase [Roseobacter sp. SK209-2-6]|uniref:thymidine phosphorylase n=1 Tax=Roseobacter sp. SK209-2-6 TaxID=388739 RepID=UPI0000F3BFD4|nr:thymidine phosphorylase [Roseobacter sp. SK209-2-6]EBA14948.1 thymidine phosphorylase [Roseobacter sp. SK209-2-6]